MKLIIQEVLNIINSMPFKKSFYSFCKDENGFIFNQSLMDIEPMKNKKNRRKNKSLNKKEEFEIMKIISKAREELENYYFLIVEECLYDISKGKRYNTLLLKVDKNTRDIIVIKKESNNNIKKYINRLKGYEDNDFSVKIANTNI